MKREVPRCAFGTPSFPHRRCVGCARALKRDLREYALAQLLGEFDRDGFTPKERRAQLAKARKAI